MKSSSKVLFLGRKEDEYCLKALTFCQDNFGGVEYYLNEWGDKIPENIGRYDCDYIIAYLSTWIIPEYVLKNVKNTMFWFISHINKREIAWS